MKDRISRGQQKLLAATLLMAQWVYFSKEALMRPTFLLVRPEPLAAGALVAVGSSRRRHRRC